MVGSHRDIFGNVWKLSEIFLEIRVVCIWKSYACVFSIKCRILSKPILGDPGAASRDDEIFMGESLQQERESPWALTLTERVPEAFQIPPSDWPENFFLANQRRGTAGRLSCLLTRGWLFLINRRSNVAHSTGTFLRRASEKKTLILNK